MSDFTKIEATPMVATAPDTSPEPAPEPAPAKAAVPDSEPADAGAGAATGHSTDEPAVAAVATVIEETKDEKDVSKVIDEFQKLATSEEERVRYVQQNQGHLRAAVTFTDPSLKLPPHIRDALILRMRFERPSKIQAATIPHIMDGHNIIAQAQSGSGKTVAFTCGLLGQIDVRARGRVQALCLAPTRELADQICRDAVAPLSANMPELIVEKLLGGVRVERGSKSSAHLVVGTPGRILDLVKQKYLDLSGVKIFVLDEADMMVAKTSAARSLGQQTLEIKANIPPTAQILFFSATFTEDIIKFSKSVVPRAYVIVLKNTESLVLKVIKQIKINTSRVTGGKLRVLQDIYTAMSIQQSIVFCEMKEEANQVSRMMNDTGYTVSTLHGDLDNETRDAVMNDFREGKSKVLITTNALARGVDVPTVAVVVNYDLPIERKGSNVVPDYATYVHRIGRSGRFGRPGTAINFIHKPEDIAIMNKIEEFYSPGKPMCMEWDSNDIDGLAKDHNERVSSL